MPSAMESNRSSLALKNVRRRLARSESGTQLYRQGRKNRRDYAHNGAFGNAKAKVYNRCILGTHLGVKRDETEEEKGE